jgi:phosphomannomutase/phosphoglucomutase
MSNKLQGNYPVRLNEMNAVISTLVQFKRVLDHDENDTSFLVNESDDDDLELSGFFDQPDDVSFSNQPSSNNYHVSESDLDHNEALELTTTDPVVTTGRSSGIYRAYDIRGIVGHTLTKEIVYDIGRALGTSAREHGCKTMVVGRDGRTSSPTFADSLAKGIASVGCNVLDIGMVPTPVLYFVTQHSEGRSGVMVTGSHNPAEYNGLKMVINGETLAGDRIQQLKQCIDRQAFADGGHGNIDHNSRIVNEYIGTISEDVHIDRPMLVVLDCGNGVAGELGPVLLRTLGCEVVELFCEVDGSFPNHHPDPSRPENLAELISAVKHYNADIGLAFDGDGDRLGVVDSHGKIIWPDRQMMLFAKDVLAGKPGSEIIFDVKCSRHLPEQIKKFGGRPLMWKTGHSFMKAKIKETGAKLAGEMSGHIFFNDRWFGFDDALYAAARLVEILSRDTRNSADIFAGFPDSINTPELTVLLTEGENFKFIENMFAKAHFSDGKITNIDGMRVDFANGWGLVRASNTTPSLVIRFEADSNEAMQDIQNQFRQLMKQIKPNINLPF